MADIIDRLVVELAADVRSFEKGMATAQGTVRATEKSIGASMAGVAKSAGHLGSSLTKGVTLPLVGLGTAAIIGFAGVEKGIREVNTLFGQTGDAAEKSFQELSAGVRDLSKNVGIAQNVLVSGLYQAISAGVPRENAFTFMEVASKAAIAGVTDVQTAVDGLTTIINAFGLSSTDAAAVADSMFTAVKGGKTTFRELSDSLFQVAAPAAAAGLKFQEVNAALAAMTSQGIPTAVASERLRATLTGLAQNTGKLNPLFKEFGGVMGALRNPGVGLAGVLKTITGRYGTQADALLPLLGSTEAVGAVQALAANDFAKLNTEIEAQTKATGATEKAFTEMEKSTARKFERFKVNVQSASQSLGAILAPAVGRAAEMLSSLATKFEQLSPGTQDLLVKFGLIVAVIGPALIVFAKLTMAIKGVADAAKLAVANPYVLLIAGLAVLGAMAFFAATKHQQLIDDIDKFNAGGWVEQVSAVMPDALQRLKDNGLDPAKRDIVILRNELERKLAVGEIDKATYDRLLADMKAVQQKHAELQDELEKPI